MTQRQAHDNARSAAFTVRYSHASAMGARHRVDKRESKPVPVRIGSFYPALTYVLQHFRSESRAVILHRQPCCIAFSSDFHLDGARVRQVFQFVVKKIGNHAMKQ